MRLFNAKLSSKSKNTPKQNSAKKKKRRLNHSRMTSSVKLFGSSSKRIFPNTHIPIMKSLYKTDFKNLRPSSAKISKKKKLNLFRSGSVNLIGCYS